MTLHTASGARRRTGATDHGIPLGRIISTELRKMFDTRSGFWLMAGIGIVALLATAAVIAFASDDQLTYATFTSAINIPLTVLLPVIAILSVTGEWTQRSGLTSFTLVPHLGRVIAAKAIASVGVAVVTVALAFGIGALGNLVGTGVAGIHPVWNLGVLHLATLVLANVLSVLFGFTFGRADPELGRSSAGVRRLPVPAADARPDPQRLPNVVPRPPALGRLRLRPERPVRRGTHHPTVDPPRLHRNAVAGHSHDHRACSAAESRSEVATRSTKLSAAGRRTCGSAATLFVNAGKRAEVIRPRPSPTYDALSVAAGLDLVRLRLAVVAQSHGDRG